MKKLILKLSIFTGLSLPAISFAQYSYLDYPGASDTYAQGISGDYVVGQYQLTSSSPQYGFIYQISSGTYTPLNWTSAMGAYGTDGSTVVGFYNYNYGYTYNIGSGVHTAMANYSGSYLNEITPNSVQGDSVVGYLVNSTQLPYWSGFVYSLSSQTYTLLNDPLADPSQNGTLAEGISGNNIVGYYQDASGNWNGYVYNLLSNTYATLNDPNSPGNTQITGISGNNIVGNNDNGSFFYDGVTWAEINLGTNGGAINGVDGNTIVGNIYDVNGDSQGFISTIAPTPEPGCLVLGSFGALGLWFFRRRK
jgi:hypothetical protein